MLLRHGDRCIAYVSTLRISCDDCGREREIAAAEILAGALPPHATVNELGRRLRCRYCLSLGGEAANVLLWPRWA